MIGKIIVKEIRELFKKSTLIAMIMMAVLFAYLGKTMSGFEDKLKEKPKISVINNDKGEFSKIFLMKMEENAEVIIVEENEETAIQAHPNNNTSLIILSNDFTENIKNGEKGDIRVYYFLEGAGLLNSFSTSTVRGVLHASAIPISDSLIICAGNAEPNIAREPIMIYETTHLKGRSFNNLAPKLLNEIIRSQTGTVPILIMMLIIISGSSVIASMGVEKEDKTLETLLSMPVKRSDIIIRKIIGSAVVGIVFAGIYMIGFKYYMDSSVMYSIDPASYGLTLSIKDLIMGGISFFASLLAGLSMCMVLGAFTKDYKASQSMVFPITLMAMFAMFLSMFMDINSMPTILKTIYLIIPFSHPMFALREMMFGNVTIVIYGIIYCMIFFAIMIGISVWIFNSDILLIGKTTWLKKRK